MTTPFNVHRAILYPSPDPQPLPIARFTPLAQALETGLISSSTDLLLAHFAEQIIAVPTLALIYHHVVEGTLDGHVWLISFCALCNSGAVFSPLIDGQQYHFASQGFYNAMILLADRESQSYWNHITGECMHGAMLGKQLERLANLLQMNAQKALAAYPTAQLLIPDFHEEATALEWNRIFRLAPIPAHEEDEELIATLGADDLRLPRYDMGLGLWGKMTRRYYPITRLHDANNALIDKLDGENILIFIEDEGGLPIAFYTNARGFTRIGSDLHLNNGQILRDGVLYQGTERLPLRLPNQQAIRWYGFAAMFPNCEIYG